MSFIVGILTFFLVINCLLLILLVLVQLPKKDAGAGIAFGGGTADALFGAGSGNVLTKITKYATGVLLVLSLFLGYLQDKVNHNNSASVFEKQVEQKQTEKPTLSTPAPATTSATAPNAASSAAAANNLLSTIPVATNAPAAK
jgi:preprotein translocase subunit SecG